MNHSQLQAVIERYMTVLPLIRIYHKHPNRRSFVILIILLVITGGLSPASATEQVVRSMSEIESGTLLFETDNRNHYLRAPLLETSVEIGVQGLLARTIVEQHFSNDSTDWVEGIYAFPLPDNATVDELTMIIGESTIDGIIQTRKKARRTYEQARTAGKKASLLEKQRPNFFTTRVANIPPGESVSIRISYQSSVRYVDGEFSLYFPLTITPRYIPAASMSYNSDAVIASSSQGWTKLTDVQDAADITPPMTDNASRASISVSLDTGLSGLTINSSTHDIVTTPSNTSNGSEPVVWNVALANNTIPADRDFKLTWTPQVTTAPVAAVFRQDVTHPDSTESFASIMVMPPQQIFSESIPPREVVFVVDTSSSMGGNSIRQARKTLALGIERLTSTDLFNVIEFDNNSSKLFTRSVNATDDNKNRAINWVQGLAADGGTEILGAMMSALEAQSPSGRIRQIVFVTDGSVGNEAEIFTYLKNNIGTSRLFTVGIGSAPNTWFMRKSAELGRGTYTSIANTTELAEKALSLLAKLERPALTNVKIAFNTDNKPEVFPVIMPDVYMGEPVLADARWQGKTEGDIEITGTYAGQAWSQTIKLGALSHPTTANNTQGLDKLWAFRKIEALEDTLLHNNNHDQVEASVTKIALDYSLVTKYTSLVAVENKVSRDPAINNLHTASVPQAIPSGSTMYYPQGSLGTTLRFLSAIIFALLALLLTLTRSRQPDTSIVCTPLPVTPRK